jgi:RNA recognition motif-containing protein
MASESPPASVLEVVGHDIGRVFITRAAADVIAPGVRPILPPLVALLAEHTARGDARTEHRVRGRDPVRRPGAVGARRGPTGRTHRGRGMIADETRAQRTRRTIFVGNLPDAATTADVAGHVERACGSRPLDVFLLRRPDGRLAGVGYVELRTEADAARVIAAGLPELAGRPLVVDRRRPRADLGETSVAPTPAPKQTARGPADVFLRGVPAAASDFDIELHVAAVAPVLRVGVPRSRDGTGIGIAFVVLANPADAQRVVHELDGVAFQGRALRVTFARGRGAA